VVIETVGQVTSVSIFEDFLFYACPNLITFIKTPKLPNEFKVKAHSRQITGMAYSTKKKVLATFTSGDKIVKLWNTEKTESLFCIKELENEIGIFCLCLSGDQRHLYVSLVNKSIKKWNLDDFNCESFASGDYIANSMICSPDNRFLISIDNNSKCFVRNTSDGSISMSFTHHKMGGIGVTVTHLSNILLTLGSDHSILLYNLGLGKKIGKMEGFTSEGVKMKVSIDDRLLALTTLEEGLFIWSIEKQSLLMHKKILNTKCSEVAFTQDNQNLILQTFNIDGSRYFFYSLSGFELLFSITSDRQSMSMSLISDEKMIVCGEDSFLYLRENPLKLETFSVVGPTTKYPVKYFKYITELDSGERQDYIEDMNNFVITPSLLGTLHFYAYKNLTIHLEKALKSGFNPFLSRNSSEIMSISLEKFFVDSVGIILRQVVEDLKTNPYAACYLENCLSRLTQESHAELEDFYKALMFIPNDKSLPKFTSYQNTFFKSQYFEILPKTMVVESNYEKSVKFYQSGVRVSCDVGGSDSIQYLENLLKTGNNEIFRSRFVEALLMEKWKEIRWFAELYAALYLSYLVVLALFTLKNENGFIVVMVVQNVLLALYEVYQLGVTRVDYFKDTLNLVDLARFLIFIVYFSLGAQVRQLLFFLNMASWFRGISHFRVFTSTRYLVNLLIEVVKDICPFLILLFYFTLGFTFMMLSLQENQSYSNFTQISETYLLNFGDFSMNDTSGSWEWLCFVISSIVNFLVMVNLLISIIGDTYDKVQAFRQIADRREMTQIILEIEYLMIWRRNNNTKSFVHIIKEDSLNQEEDFWEGKVKVLQDAITSINDTISAQNSETERKLLTITSEISEIKAGITKLLNSKS
jgi:WD40 repeat protein